MKKKTKVLLVCLSLTTLVACGDTKEQEGIETPFGTMYFGLRPENEAYLGLKPETLDDLQEHRDKFEEENQDNTFKRDIGLAMMDKAIQLIEENGWYVEE